ncbi:phosphoenolpyruvate hydrolase family protein [uncultured Nocardioides sp.]|uniref:phosphoenolpyruvate hydrolase family protein n=1 Tax=uncultured Nocardioides sp. TaxID=198441 RepID=UPI00261DA2D0|nr:phosphoenolpyruvate hydrolase family protein [uncultured Nocardioides sp.]
MTTRDEVLARLRAQVEQGRPIIGTGAGTGISAKFAERGGADLILIYNSGRFRMAGHGSNAGLLALGDANAIVLEMGEREVLPVVRDVPVIAGVNGTDPTRVMPRFLRTLEQAGFAGVINFPSHGIIDGRWRESLEATGFGYDREVEMIATAASLGLFTMAYVFTPDEARRMAEAGVDVVVAHMGLTVGGSIGASSDFAKTLDDCVVLIEEIATAARKVNEDVLVVSHGGPLAGPDDVAFVLERTTTVGFVGASSIERIPIEEPIADVVDTFKRLPMGPLP